MTDDKGASEGPYRVVQPVDMIPLTVEGPTGNHGLMLQGEFLCNALNAAHTAGRKSMEKDLKELLEMMKYVVDRVGDSGPFGQMHALEKLRAWKKARGVE